MTLACIRTFISRVCRMGEEESANDGQDLAQIAHFEVGVYYILGEVKDNDDTN